MARMNAPPKPEHFTHEGAPAKRITSEQQLRRSVMACMLWEREFYEDGKGIADRIQSLVADVKPIEVAQIAVEARHLFKMRHAPLLLACSLAYQHPGNPITATTVEQVIRRADELAEILAIHARVNGVSPSAVKRVIPAQMKKGIARAFEKFDGYQLAKYNRPGAITLRDAMFLTHPKPRDDNQAKLWQRLIDGTLEAPDTWEVGLSKAGNDPEAKRAVYQRLLDQGRLGYMALLRNLRKMLEVGIDADRLSQAIEDRRGAGMVLPFRFIAAARQVPRLEGALDNALTDQIQDQEPLRGKTVILVDVSYSMEDRLSSKSDLTRMDAAAALAAVVPTESRRVFTFSNDVVEVPARRGMAGVAAVIGSQFHRGTDMRQALEVMNTLAPYDRLIVITDELTRTRIPDPQVRHAYMINVASARNGVGYGAWTHIDGFSEAVIDYIREFERFNDQ